MQDSTIDAYLRRSTRWRQETVELRAILLGCQLDEALKWGKPCSTADGKNIAIIQPMKAFLALMFFKGALLDDPKGLLEAQGPNSRSARRLRFASAREVQRLKAAIQGLVRQAIEVEHSGRVVPKEELVLAPELAERLAGDPELATAFGALTAGRRREYNLHICSAKQPKTRAARVQKHRAAILAGKGLRDA